MEQVAGGSSPQQALERYRGAILAILGVSILGYFAYAAWSGLADTGRELATFDWPIYAVVLVLTLVNYGLRYAKWAWLLGRVGARMPTRENLWTFAAGLGMVVSPGKAGELVKPWLVGEVVGAPMARTIPVLVTERLMDALAVVILAGFGVTTFQPDSTATIATMLVAVAVGLVVLAVEPLAHAVIGLLGRLPVVGKAAPKLLEAYDAMRTCVGPVSLVVTLLLSLVAWFAECVGCWLVFRGFGVDAGLEASTFLYASATAFGGLSPAGGGLGISDLALAEGAVRLLPGVTAPQAFAAALLVRLATLWFGVLLGAVALLRIDRVIAGARKAAA